MISSMPIWVLAKLYSSKLPLLHNICCKNSEVLFLIAILLFYIQLANIDSMSSGEEEDFDTDHSPSSSREPSPGPLDSLSHSPTFHPIVLPHHETPAYATPSDSRQSSRPSSGTPHHGRDPNSSRVTPTAETLEWDTSYDGSAAAADETDSKWKFRPRLEEIDQKDCSELLEECQSRIEAVENCLRCATPTGPQVEIEIDAFVSSQEELEVAFDKTKVFQLQ